jgi:GNAT superfamily N-acetyltransferase
MDTPSIRPMLDADVVPAAEVLRRGEWGDRESFFRFAVAQPTVRPFVAERAGDILGTGVASAHGIVGWIGTIFVAEAERGRGLGRALTEAVIGGLDALGCRTLVLVATDAGRAVYEKLGFEIRTHYQTFEIEGRAGGSAGVDPGVTPFSAADLAEAIALDELATGEQRGSALAAFADLEGGLALPQPDGALEGFVLRAPWGGGATIATSPVAALRLLEARRLRSGPNRLVRAGLPLENQAGRAALETAGWRPTWQARRMERGPRLDWQPDWLWGQFNMAMG